MCMCARARACVCVYSVHVRIRVMSCLMLFSPTLLFWTLFPFIHLCCSHILIQTCLVSSSTFVSLGTLLSLS